MEEWIEKEKHSIRSKITMVENAETESRKSL
jgi:hypothetical protein